MIKQIKKVCLRSINPIAKGCFIWIKTKLIIIQQHEIIKLKISENSLNKILILEINDKEFLFFWSFKRTNSYFWFTRPMFLLNY